MTVEESISDILSSLNDIFETDQEEVIKHILRAEKVFFLDTCFITRLFYIQPEKVFNAFERIAEGREKKKAVFVVTELVLYELKDSKTNRLQDNNKRFFDKMSEYGFCLLVLNEESICSNIRPFLTYSNKKWNKLFSGLIHDNIANLHFNGLVLKDKRMPYFGFSEAGYSVPGDGDFIKKIILYLKNTKTNNDSMAEELVCTSLFSIFELIHGSNRTEYIFCSNDYSAIARINKTIQTSYPDMQKQLKSIHMFSFVQFVVSEGIVNSKDEVLRILRKTMGENVKLIINEKLPFASAERIVMLEEAVEMLFDGEQIQLVGSKK